MAWVSRRAGFLFGERGISARAAAVGLIASAGAAGLVEPAVAQIRGDFFRGGGSGAGGFSVRPPRGAGEGPVWGGGGRRPFYPGPVRIQPWIEPRQSRVVEEVVIVRPRQPPPEIEPEPRSPRKARPAAKKPVREAAVPPTRKSPPPAGTRPEPARPPVARGPRPVPAPQQHLPGEVVVELSRAASPGAVGDIARQYGLAAVSAQPVSLLDTTLHRFRIRNGRPVEAVVRSLGRDGRVASAQPNFIFRLQGEAAGSMAGLQYARAKLRLPEAHELTTGEGVTVAVIDSGIDGAHPELAGAVSANLNASGADPKPDAHGTAIAGIIAARAKLLGAAPAASVLAIAAFAPDRKAGETRGVSTDIVRAISLAAEGGVRLANLSFAGPSDPLLSRAIAAAHRRGIIFVAAAGNGGPKATPAYPAADPNVIAVTATDQKDALFTAANRGPYVGVAAPGVDVLVAAPGHGYKLSSGTSMAAAHVTGILALAMQKRPDLTLAQARSLLMETARDLGPKGSDPEFGSGLVDARRSVERAAEGVQAAGQLLATVPDAP